jgi:hypothetical protein
MKKSKKKEKSSFKEQELDIKRATELVKKSIPSEAEFIVTPTPRKMINRREVQAEIDIDKKIRAMLATGHYDHNQIASMVRGANLQRVKDVSK